MMNRVLCIVFVAGICLFAIACGIEGASPSGPGSFPGQNPQFTGADPQPGGPSLARENILEDDSPLWKLRYSTQCPTTTPVEKCKAAYGFSIYANGKFEIGPGPKKEWVSGRVGVAEFETVNDAVLLILSRQSEDRLPENCGEDTKDSAVLTSRTGGNAKLCLNSSNHENKALKTALKNLVAKYYPETFPNPCVDAMLNLEKVYDSYRECKKDSDCAYVNEKDLPVDLREAPAIVVDDCTYIQPLLVANKRSVETNPLGLLMEREITIATCAKDLKRAYCHDSVLLGPVSGAPACAQGVCKAPSVVF